MQTIQIKIDDANLEFFIELVKRLNFVKEVQVDDMTIHEEQINNLITLPEGKPSISDFAGLWSDNPKTIEQIREKAWRRI